jgi:ribosome-associated toxin RatA of RatAB toxin-antitoxin module
MAKVNRSIEINATPEHVFKVITDYEKYPEFLTGAKRVTAKRNGNTVDVTNEIAVVGTSIKYTLRMVEKAPHEISWSLVDGQFMKSNDGLWKLESAGEGKTRAHYSIDIGVGMLVPKSVINGLVDSGLPKMLEEFKARAEKLAKG